jgi:hypothetical protein
VLPSLRLLLLAIVGVGFHGVINDTHLKIFLSGVSVEVVQETRRMSRVICIDKRENDPYPIVASKGNGLRYGSAGTISTDLQTASSSLSSSQASSSIQEDLTSVANSDSSEDNLLLPPRSSESSYSDISERVFEEDGYHDRLARRQRRSKDAWSFIKNSIFTLCNFKLVLSFAVWFISYMIMGVFGGSVAYLHFERSDRSVPDPLPDFGYDLIPVSKPANLESFYSSLCGIKQLMHPIVTISLYLMISIVSIGVLASHTFGTTATYKALYY